VIDLLRVIDKETKKLYVCRF